MVKCGDFTKHLANLQKILECTRNQGLKMNPTKCAFGVSVDQFLGFMVHQRGIEISKRSIDAINKVVAPTNKTDRIGGNLTAENFKNGLGLVSHPPAAIKPVDLLAWT